MFVLWKLFIEVNELVGESFFASSSHHCFHVREQSQLIVYFLIFVMLITFLKAVFTCIQDVDVLFIGHFAVVVVVGL